MTVAEVESENPVVANLRQILRKFDSQADLKITEQLDIFKNTDCVVVCEDCGTVFFVGLAETLLSEKRFVDWKLLSFRHVWDRKHKVVVFLPYFDAAIMPLHTFNSLISPEDNTKILYYTTVEEMRERYLMRGDERANRSFDENWMGHDRCVCSTCGSKYFDPKDACYCCYGTKAWMPFSEVDLIRVGQS